MKEKYFKLYDKLPPPIAAKAKELYDWSFARARRRPTCVSDAVLDGFSWHLNLVFWRDVRAATTFPDSYSYPSMKTYL